MLKHAYKNGFFYAHHPKHVTKMDEIFHRRRVLYWRCSSDDFLGYLVMLDLKTPINSTIAKVSSLQ
jgi:hypothetical protein